MPKKKRPIFNQTRINRKRQKLSRAKKSEEERSQARESDKTQHAVRRSNETAQETEARLAQQRLRTAKRRSNKTGEEMNQRRTSDRLRASISRATESEEQQQIQNHQMTPSDQTQTARSCCHRCVIQYREIKAGLKSIRQTVDVAVKLPSKSVGLAPNDIQAMVNSNGVTISTSGPIMDSLPVIYVSDNGLRTDTAEEPMDVAVLQPESLKGASVKMENSTETENDETVIETDNNKIIIEVEGDNDKTDLCNTTSSNLLPATCDFSASKSRDVCTNSLLPTIEVDLDVVKVKQEQRSEYNDDDLTVFSVDVEERLQRPEVKMEPEGVFISDTMLPVCVLVKKEGEYCTSNTQENSTTSLTVNNSMEKLKERNSIVNTGDELNTCGMNQGIGHMVQDPTYQVTSKLRALLGNALVSKLKQKIQEKIQAAVRTVNIENMVNEDESNNLANTNKCVEISHSFKKDCKNLKLMATQSKFRQKFYQCRSCAKIFFCKIACCVHKNHCRGLRKQYHCSSCPLIFKSKAVLFNHRQLHSTRKSKGRHKCEMCGREFILKSTLKKHRQSQVCKGTRMKCYRKLPQYFCGECGEVCLSSTNLDLHQELHKVDETHSSSNDVANTDTGNQTAPAVVPRTVRRYPCSYCDEAFIDRRSVTLHEKLHTDKEFAAFDQERRMIQRRHQLTMMLQQQQSNRKKYGCDVCGRCYPIELLYTCIQGCIMLFHKFKLEVQN